MVLSEAQRREARAELTDLLQWEEVARSPQLARFLQYVVEAALCGQVQNIKAYAIAVDVFGRPANFDPQGDPIVRVQARRLRSLLDRYYDAGLSRHSIRVRLPVGRYVPEFDVIGAPDSSLELQPGAPAPDSGVEAFVDSGLEEAGWPAPPLRPASRIVLAARLGLALVAIVAVLAAIGFEHGWFRQGGPASALPATPQLAIAAFGNMTGDPSLDSAAIDFGRAIATNLLRFDQIGVTIVDAGAPSSDADAALTLAGFIRRSGTDLEFEAVVLGPFGSSTWATSINEPVVGGDHGVIVGDAARAIAGRIAVDHGPLYDLGRAWLGKQTGLEDQPTAYTCMLRFNRLDDRSVAGDLEQTKICFERLLANGQPNAPALAALSWLDARALLRQARAGDNLSTMLQPALDAAQRAIGLAPHNSFVRAQLARVLDAALQRDDAKLQFITALQFNPANLDARAAYAQTLALAGDWPNASSEATVAITAQPSPPPWYYETPMLDNYRQGNYSDAIDAALIYAAANKDLPVVLALAAAGEAKRQDIIDQFLGQLMDNTGYRSAGILPKLGLRITDPALLQHIAEGLILAGVPQKALSHAF